MKNLILFLFVVTGLLLSSCKDSIKFEEIPAPTLPEVKIKDVLALSPQAQKVLFPVLRIKMKSSHSSNESSVK